MVNNHQTPNCEQVLNTITNKSKNFWKNWKDQGQTGYLGPNMLELEFKGIKSKKLTEEISVDINPVQHERSFHQMIYPVLFLAQVFALFPVYGIQCKTAKELKFKFFSMKSVYSLVITVSIATIVFVTLLWAFEDIIVFGKFGKI